jgi:DNA helicase-2/ATP-dependent DNA helicase PcrA
LFETELRQAKIPYVLVGGMSFYDRKEVRDIVAYLKLLASPGDEVALRRIINTPPRGIGPKAQTALVDEAVAQGKPVSEVMRVAKRLTALPPTAVEAIGRFDALLSDFRQRLASGPLVRTVSELIGAIGYRAELARLYREPLEQQARWAAIEEVVNALAAYEKRARRPTLAGFLDDIALGDREADDDSQRRLARNAVALMTLHSAKGLEFPHVFLVGMEEGLLPHRLSVEAGGAAIDEERRLCYVGITRARRRLTITLARERLKWGKMRESIPSRFLFEITGQVPKTRRSRSVGKARKPPARQRTSRRKP